MKEKTMKTFHQFLKCEQAVTAMEYGLIVGLLSVAGIIASSLAGNEVRTSFSTISSTLSSANR